MNINILIVFLVNIIMKSKSAVNSGDKELLKKTLLPGFKGEEQELNSFLDLFEPVSFKKNQLIVSEGQLQEYFYFICKGIIRIYFIKNGKPAIEWFVKEGEFFGSIYSQTTNKPIFNNYHALEDMRVLRIKYAVLNDSCNRSHEIEHLYRILLEASYRDYEVRFYSFANLNSDERYHYFISEYGNIMNRISLKYVASYLGMTSETLSRIRAKYDRSAKIKS